VLYVFFTKVAHVNGSKTPGQEHYGAQLLGSIVLFTFFAEATAGAVRSVVDRENLVRKIQFPRLAIPISVVLLAGFNLGLNLIVVMIFAVISGVRPMLSWIELPLIVALLAVLTCGVAVLLSALFVRFRDIQPIWEVLAQILFYCSPVIIPVEKVKEALAHGQVDHILYRIYLLNPLVTVFQQFRHAMINHAALSARAALAGWATLLEPIAIVTALFVLGFWYFNRQAPHIAEDL